MQTVTQTRRKHNGKPAMTAEEARTFRAGERVAPMIRLSMAVADRQEHGQHPVDCRCEPYRDFFTFRRWKAQGRSIRKGARSFCLPIILDDDGATDDGLPEDTPRHRKPRFWTARVFCRCQTCEPGQESVEPWTYVVPKETQQAEKTRKVDTAESAVA